jgi:hypothetical protein
MRHSAAIEDAQIGPFPGANNLMPGGPKLPAQALHLTNIQPATDKV